MLIRYTGPKASKTVTWAGQEYVFAPTCEIRDMEFANWLLHVDRQWLFVVEEPATTSPAGENSSHAGENSPEHAKQEPVAPQSVTTPAAKIHRTPVKIHRKRARK